MTTMTKCSLIIWFFAVLVAVSTVPALAQGTNWLIGTAPDWNQPYDYTPVTIPGGGPGPWPQGPVGPWIAWCAPTSASNMVGYWEDARGSRIADGAVAPATANWAIAASWHDYNADGTNSRPPKDGATNGVTTDIGWYMDTNRLGMNRGDLVPHAGTKVKNIHIGIADYLADRAPGWLQSVPLGAVKTEGRIGSGVAYTTNPANPAQMWATPAQAFAQIRQEIDADMPVIVSWTNWNLQNTGLQLASAGTGESSYGGDYYTWLPYSGWGNPDPGGHGEVWNGDVDGDALGHATTAVGYILAGSLDDMWQQAGLMGPTDWVIVHDNWAITGRNVIVPFDMGGFTNWVANTTMVPEPAALVLLAIALAMMWIWRQRR